MFIIGDTETDVLVGKNSGIKTVAITNGIRNAEIIKASKPNYIFDDINEFAKWYSLR